MKQIENNIKALREKNGYTQEQLAKMVGCKAAYISALERGERSPGKKLRPRLCDALMVDEMTLLYGDRAEPQKELTYEEKVLLQASTGLSSEQLQEAIRYMMQLKASGGSKTNVPS